ncbi:hypothetical protein YC2023_098794 [Brassica napus]
MLENAWYGVLVMGSGGLWFLISSMSIYLMFTVKILGLVLFTSVSLMLCNHFMVKYWKHWNIYDILEYWLMDLIEILHCLFPLVLFEVFLCCWNISDQNGLVGLYWYVSLDVLVVGEVASWAGGPGTFSCFNMGDRFSLVLVIGGDGHGFMGSKLVHVVGVVGGTSLKIVPRLLGNIFWTGGRFPDLASGDVDPSSRRTVLWFLHRKGDYPTLLVIGQRSLINQGFQIFFLLSNDRFMA